MANHLLNDLLVCFTRGVGHRVPGSARDAVCLHILGGGVAWNLELGYWIDE